MDEYLIDCWNCTGQYDARAAVWCNCDPRNPTKLCPYCLQCFCAANREYLIKFWKNAPLQLQQEKFQLNSTQGQLGHILVSTGLVSVQQLIDGLAHSKANGKKLGESMVELGFILESQMNQALERQCELTGAVPRPAAQTIAPKEGAAHAGVAPPTTSPEASRITPSPTPLSSSSPDLLKDALNNLLVAALKKHASALYLEPTGGEVTVRARIDGILVRLKSLPADWLPGLMQRIKRMAHLDPEELKIPQSGRFSLRMGERSYDIMLQTLPSSVGEGAGIRIIDRSRLKQELPSLGFEPADYAKFIHAVDSDRGLIILTGPHFNSVTETAYSILNHQAMRNRKVVSLESPIASALTGVNQLEVQEGDRAAFVRALKTLLNMSPDVVFLSDLPDGEILKTVSRIASAVQVFASIDCPTTFQTLERLRAFDVSVVQPLAALQLIVSQRVIRRNCSHCLERTPITPSLAAEMGLDRDEMHLTPEVAMCRGCSHCNDLGYTGTKMLYETMAIDDEIREIARSNGTQEDLERALTKQGFISLRMLHLREVAKLSSSPEEYIRGAYPRPVLKRIFRVK